jgi:hypothetical protein
MSGYQFFLTSPDILKPLKQKYLTTTTAPLDGMWESGFIPVSDHYTIAMDDLTVGYIVINDDGYILQFYAPDHGHAALKQAIDTLKIKGAFVSTAEEPYLSLVKVHEKTSLINALMYQEFTPLKSLLPFNPGHVFSNVSKNGLEQVVDFAHNTLGANREWLSGYYTILMNREELYALYSDDQIIATGECRISDTQKPYADVGMIVGTQYRGQGTATVSLTVTVS